MESISQNKYFGGHVIRLQHKSTTTNCLMHLSIFEPPQAKKGVACPAVLWLSGLTCTDQNFMQKAGAQKVAAELGLYLICPDTSPRYTELAGEHENYDLGSGAGFYVNATQPPWSNHYNMYAYITQELPELLEQASELQLSGKYAICGHSMGGHGAIICALKNPKKYVSVSAFSPITSPSECPWGQKAFNAYLGENTQAWKAYDSYELVKALHDSTTKTPILIDQGLEDEFLESQLMPKRFESLCQSQNYPLTYREQAGYDHSYYFIASFIEEHLRYHEQAFKNNL